jgi:hypothetical protein
MENEIHIVSVLSFDERAELIQACLYTWNCSLFYDHHVYHSGCEKQESHRDAAGVVRLVYASKFLVHVAVECMPISAVVTDVLLLNCRRLTP